MNRPKRLLRLATLSCLTVAALTGLTGCLTVRATLTSETNPICLAQGKALTFSRNDTPDTVQEVRQANAVLRAVCKWPAPKPAPAPVDPIDPDPHHVCGANGTVDADPQGSGGPEPHCG